jgi:leucyl-tRNA synthetase
MMSLVNDFTKKGSVTKGEYMTLITLLNPVAPHMTEELWEIYGGKGFLSVAKWPEYDEAKTVDNEIEIVVQINGKIKERTMVAADADKDAVLAQVKSSDIIKSFIDGKTIVKEIVVPGKLVNIVVR